MQRENCSIWFGFIQKLYFFPQYINKLCSECLKEDQSKTEFFFKNLFALIFEESNTLTINEKIDYIYFFQNCFLNIENEVLNKHILRYHCPFLYN